MTVEPSSSVVSTPSETCNTGGILLPRPGVWVERIAPLLRQAHYLYDLANQERCAFARAYLQDIVGELENFRRRAGG